MVDTQRNIDPFFPFDNIRDQQREAIQFALKSFLDDKKRVVLLDLGTGIGKSAIGLCIAGYMNSLLEPGNSGAYVLTTQKVLQDQYVNDFGLPKRDLLRSIKSSTNYQCMHNKDLCCGESRRMLNKMAKQLEGTEFYTRCKTACPYVLDKRAFVEAAVGVTNFSYFLAETMYAGQLKPRKLLIVDECHTVEDTLSKFIEVAFSEKFYKNVLQCKRPKSYEQQVVFDWINKTYKPALAKKLAVLGKSISGCLADDMVGISEFSKQYETLDKHMCKVNRFIKTYDEKNWIMNVSSSAAGKKFEFKPVDVSNHSQDALFKFGDKILMMSATVLDKKAFCKSVGLDPDDVAFLRMPSPFPVENRRVHYMPVGSMSKANIDRTLPLMAEAVRMLLEQHPNEKGMIHANTYKIVQYLYEHVGSDRLLIHDSSNREAVLKNHIQDPRPTVLLSPSMTEGIDLSDDASRFQVLCKVPFPYLGDNVVKKRMERDPSWYDYQTAKTVIQAFGRSIRNEKDHAVSYILDSSWYGFYARNSAMFPSDFKELLVGC